MGNLKEIRTRISSVSSTKQITNAMKMVSAAKLKKAQDHILQLRPYSEKLQEILNNLNGSNNKNPYSDLRKAEKILVVAISSNRGLCGAFNTNIVKKAIELKKETYKAATVDIYAIGKKVADGLKYKNIEVKDQFHELFDELNFENSLSLSEKIIQGFLDAEYDKVILVYNQFKNAANQVVLTEDFLPVVGEESAQEVQSDYIFEPSKEFITTELIPKGLKIQFFKAVLDSFASEHGARMTAMHKATDNASDLLENLKLTYNKARQAAITNEILEIVGGAEALN